MATDKALIIRESFAAFNRGEIEAVLAHVHPEVEIELVGGFSDLMGTGFHGHEGARRFFADWFATFETMQLEVERLLDQGERVIAFTKLTATVAGSEQPVEVLGGAIYAFDDGKVINAGFFYDRGEMCRAAGIPD
jgi:ketosteroid isomerase-like protein